MIGGRGGGGDRQRRQKMEWEPKKKKPRDQYLAYNYLRLPGLLRKRNGDEREGTGRR